MSFFTNAKSLRLMVAAGVVAFYFGTGAAFGAHYTYTGADDAGVSVFDETKSGNYVNTASDKITATGGNATTGSGSGGSALHIQGNYTNNGETEANGGEAYSTSGSVATGGVGIEIDGDIYNEAGKITAVGGKGYTDNYYVTYFAGIGGAGILAANATLYNHAEIEATGGYGYDHNGLGGVGISIKNLNNYSVIKTVGGDAYLAHSGNDLSPTGGSGMELSGDLYNEGIIEGIGGAENDMGSPSTYTCGHPVQGGDGMIVAGTVENNGTLKGFGGTATTSKNHPVVGGVGLRFNGYVTNNKDVAAQGGDGVSTASYYDATGGTGVIFAGGLTNNDIISAKGGNAETRSSGAATGGAGMIASGGSYNYGEIYAQAGKVLGGAGYGIETAGIGAIFNNGLTNYQDSFLTMLGGDAASVKLGGSPAGSLSDLPHGAWFKYGSYLALGSDNPYLDASGLDVVFENIDSSMPGAMVISLAASATSVGDGPVIHTGFIRNTSSNPSSGTVVTGQIGIGSYTGPVMDVTIGANTSGGNYNYDFTAERIGYSSQYTSGQAGSMLAALERDLIGATIDDSNAAWANILASVDFQPGVEALRDRANQLFGDTMPVHTTQSMQSMVRSTRFVDNLFSKNMQAFGKCRQLDACAYDESSRRNSNGLVCGVNNDPLMIWAQPFYYDGRQKGKRDWFQNFDETYYGVTAGVSYDANVAILSAEVHYYQGDLKTRNYKADVTALGFEVGAGRCFKIADNFNPWLEVRAGYTQMELDQKRTDLAGVQATSKPDAGVVTAGVNVNNTFKVSKEVSVTPYVGLDVAHMSMDSYTEKGSALGTSVKPQNYTSVESTVGVQLDYSPNENLYFEARAAYHHEFGDNSPDLTARGSGLSNNLKVQGDDVSRDSASLGVGVGVKLTDNVSLKANYDVKVADRYVGHQVSATLSFTF